VNVRVFTPTEVVLETEAVHVTAEDPTGSLGVRPGHAPLVTPLVKGILVVREAGGRERYVAVNGGVLIVNRDRVEVVSRQAVLSDDLARLEETVLARFEREAETDRAGHVAFEKMRLDFLRRVLEFQRAGESP